MLLEAARATATAEEDRGDYLDDWLAGWQRRAEEMAMGRSRSLSDDERADEIRSQARGDMAREAESDRELPPLDSRSTARFLGFWQSDIESASTPREQGQIIRFMEDLRTHSDALRLNPPRPNLAIRSVKPPTASRMTVLPVAGIVDDAATSPRVVPVVTTFQSRQEHHAAAELLDRHAGRIVVTQPRRLAARMLRPGVRCGAVRPGRRGYLR